MSKCLLPNCATHTGGGHQEFCMFHWGFLMAPMQKTIIRLYNNGAPLDGYRDAVLNGLGQIEDRIRSPRLDPFTNWPFRR